MAKGWFQMVLIRVVIGLVKSTYDWIKIKNQNDKYTVESQARWFKIC